jgi:hypothetical protein
MKKPHQQLTDGVQNSSFISQNKDKNFSLPTLTSLFKDDLVYCPICCNFFPQSDYLAIVFIDDRERWLANMVIHYRHSHITSWDKCWGNNGRYYRSGWFGDYDEEKSKVNERAKRQIIRKASLFLMLNGITPETFKALQGTTEETLKLAFKKLKGEKI